MGREDLEGPLHHGSQRPLIGLTRDGIDRSIGKQKKRVASGCFLSAQPSFDHFNDLTCIPCHPIIPPSSPHPRHQRFRILAAGRCSCFVGAASNFPTSHRSKRAPLQLPKRPATARFASSFISSHCLPAFGGLVERAGAFYLIHAGRSGIFLGWEARTAPRLGGHHTSLHLVLQTLLASIGTSTSLHLSFPRCISICATTALAPSIFLLALF
jgi:hypothetical protein